MDCRGERLGVGNPSETISIIQMSVDEAQNEAGMGWGWVRWGKVWETLWKETVFTMGEGEGGLISWEEGGLGGCAMGLLSLCPPNNGPRYCTLPSACQEEDVLCCALQFKRTLKNVADSVKGKKWK